MRVRDHVRKHKTANLVADEGSRWFKTAKSVRNGQIWSHIERPLKPDGQILLGKYNGMKIRDHLSFAANLVAHQYRNHTETAKSERNAIYLRE